MLPHNTDSSSKYDQFINRPEPELLSRPLIQAKHLDKIPTFEIMLVDGLDETFSDKLDRIEIRPLEYFASFLFYNNRSKKGSIVPISSITNIQIVSQTKGRLVKTEDKMIEFSFTNDQSSYKTLRFNMEDKLIDEFLTTVNVIRGQLQDRVLCRSLVLNFTNGDNTNSRVKIYPMLPYLFEGEELVWHYIDSKGIVNKKATWLHLVTNYRILEYNFIEHGGRSVFTSGIEDVIVNNQRRVSDSSRYGSYGKSKYNISGYGTSASTSKTVGNVVIIANGKPYLTFYGVSDPHGLARIIKSLKKQCNYSLEDVPLTPDIEDDNLTIIPDSSHGEVIDKKDDNSITSRTTAEIICNNCNKTNFPKSIFCSYCGQKLTVPTVCSKCNQLNAPDAQFCNKCGTKL